MIWRHKKTGGFYELIADAEHSEDLSLMVVYRSVTTGRVWVRPASEFYDGRFEQYFLTNEENTITDVVGEIRAEREYQDTKWGSLAEKPQSIPGWLLILRKELEEAEEGWMKNRIGRDSALGEIVQIAAVAVAALQQHGYEGN